MSRWRWACLRCGHVDVDSSWRGSCSRCGCKLLEVWREPGSSGWLLLVWALLVLVMGLFWSGVLGLLTR